jgi:hypothetical protein
VRHEVPAGQFGEGIIPCERPRAAHPLVEQCEGLLLTLGRAEDEQAGDAEVEQQVRAALPLGRDAARIESGEQRGATEHASIAHRTLRRAQEARVVEAQLTVPARGGPHGALRGEAEHPAEVLGGGEVQGAAHGPGAHDLAGLDGGRDMGIRRGPGTKADGPPGIADVLRLHGQQVPHYLGGGVEACVSDALGRQPQLRQLSACGRVRARHVPSIPAATGTASVQP